MVKKAESTRERILRQGLALMSQSGLTGVTLGSLADQVGMSKSGLFAHFRSKEQVQIELLQHMAQFAQAHVVQPAMSAGEGLPRLKALVNNWFGWAQRAGLPGGCAVAAGLFEFDDKEFHGQYDRRRRRRISDCHRHALHGWLLALKRANLAGLPHRWYSHSIRHLRYSINVTLDGCCDHRAMFADEDLHRHAVENLDRADALLFGRVTYEMMEAAWRQPAQTGARPAWMEPFARTIDAAKKYVVSSTLKRVDWNAELVRGDLAKAVQQLKRESGKGLFVGGVKLPLALTELGLIDKYEFVVHPRLAGHGPTLFAGLSKRIDLKLVSRLELGSGAVAMRYEPRR